MLAIIFPVPENRFACVLDAKVVGTSIHVDYWEHHFKKGNLKAFEGKQIDKFVHLAKDGSVAEVIAAEALDGKSYATCARADTNLSAGEAKEVSTVVQAWRDYLAARQPAPAEASAPKPARKEPAAKPAEKAAKPEGRAAKPAKKVAKSEAGDASAS